MIFRQWSPNLVSDETQDGPRDQGGRNDCDNTIIDRKVTLKGNWMEQNVFKGKYLEDSREWEDGRGWEGGRGNGRGTPIRTVRVPGVLR